MFPAETIINRDGRPASSAPEQIWSRAADQDDGKPSSPLSAVVTVSANAEVGDNEGRVEASVEGDGTTIAFNAKYLIEILYDAIADLNSVVPVPLPTPSGAVALGSVAPHR